MSQNACLFKLGTEFYDFTPFKLTKNVWPAYYQNITNLTNSYQYEFGFCQLLSEAENATCTTQAYAVGSDFNATETPLTQPPSDCVPYSGSDRKQVLAQTITRTQSDNTVQQGVSITYEGGQACILNGQPTSFTIKAWCDPSIAVADTQYTANVLGDECHPYVELTSSIGGCDLLSNSPIWMYLDKAEPYMGAFAIVGGFVACFYGFKLLKPTLFIVGLLSSCVLSLLFCYAVYSSSADDLKSTFWYFLGGGAVAGLLVGYLLARFVKVGAAVLAGWGGFCLGIVINEAFLSKFELVWLFWVSTVVCAIVAAGLTFKIFDHTVILATAFMGSYFMIRGVSCYAGHYYNEFTMVKLLQAGAFTEIDPFYWIYVGAFVVFVGLGAFVQFRQRPKGKPTHPYHK